MDIMDNWLLAISNWFCKVAEKIDTPTGILICVILAMASILLILLKLGWVFLVFGIAYLIAFLAITITLIVKAVLMYLHRRADK